eukprot:m.285149 g.285149  ORF g.285149 m.285149 type:complete len:384 (+) comp11309_c0_seq1:192-1343(+)
MRVCTAAMKICVDGEWYELSKWARFHPGGEEILQKFDGHDSTDVFYSLHSRKAIQQLRAMRPVEAKEDPIPPQKVDIAFRQLRQKLEEEGWFEQSMFSELIRLIPVILMVIVGTLVSYSHPLSAIFLIGLGMQQAGWLGHDMTHARNSVYSDTCLGYVSGWINGFSRAWWSDKHNTHHVLTNHKEHDPDIQMQPFLFLWAPSKSVDHHLRKYQHYYFLPLYSFLYVSWRSQSFLWELKRRNFRILLTTILPSYVWLACLPVAVSVGSILFGGLLVALVVTLSHESEEMFEEREPSYVTCQYTGTRDIVCPDPFTEYLFGGMQYQLEHHLFPTMPRYKYPALVPIVRKFGEDNNLEYKADGLFKMFKDHHATLRRNALAAAKEN